MDLRFLARRAIERAVRELQRAGRRWFPVEREERVRPWLDADGDGRLRLDYDLDERSVVLDLGGYRGQFASDVYGRFRCTVHVFEPVPAYAEHIAWRFASNPDVHVHAVALGAADGTLRLGADDDATSSFHGDGTVTGSVRRAAPMLDELGIDAVDLLKVNIEGGEYDLLDHLLEAGWLPRIRHLQVQFHDFVPDAAARMAVLQRRLAETHEPMWQYRFVWESWRRRDG